MDQRQHTAAIIDGLLRTLAVGGMITASLALPGLAIGLDKPVNKYLDRLDRRSREREMKRVLQYMNRKGLISYKRSLEHGITITERGRKRLAKANFDRLRIKKPSKWDGKWRIVIFDIPERYKTNRDVFTTKMRQLGFQPLQRSVWIHPFPCHEEIEVITLNYKLTRYVTYVESSYIDNPDKLRARFVSLLGR